MESPRKMDSPGKHRYSDASEVEQAHHGQHISEYDDVTTDHPPFSGDSGSATGEDTETEETLRSSIDRGRHGSISQYSRTLSMAPSTRSKKVRKQKNPPSPVVAIMYNLAILIAQLLIAIYSISKLVGSKILATSFMQNTVIPALDSLILNRLRLLRSGVADTFNRVRHMTLKDYVALIRSLYAYTVATAIYWYNFDYKAYFTPLPKPPPPPPPPSKPFAEIWTETLQSVKAVIDSLKQSRVYIAAASFSVFLFGAFWSIILWTWRVTSPIRSSTFITRMSLLLRNSLIGCRYVIIYVLDSKFARRLRFWVVKEWTSLSRIIVKSVLSLTPISLMVYSVKITWAKPKLDSLVVDLYQTFPVEMAEELESDIIWIYRIHVLSYCLLVFAFLGVNLWVYMPLLNNLKLITHLPFAKKYAVVMSPPQSLAQKIMIFVILIFGIATTIVFKNSLAGIDETVSKYLMRPEWTILSGFLTETPETRPDSDNVEAVKPSVSSIATQQYYMAHPHLYPAIHATDDNICPLEIRADATATTGSVVCVRGNSFSNSYFTSTIAHSPAPCKCPVQEISHCHLERTLQMASEDIHMYRVSLYCPTNPSLRFRKVQQSPFEVLFQATKLSTSDASKTLLSLAIPIFNPMWGPDPVRVLITPEKRPPQLVQTPLHISYNYESITVRFTDPVTSTPLNTSSANIHQTDSFMNLLKFSFSATPQIPHPPTFKIFPPSLQILSTTNTTPSFDAFTLKFNRSTFPPHPFTVSITPDECMGLRYPFMPCNQTSLDIHTRTNPKPTAITLLTSETVLESVGAMPTYIVQVEFDERVGRLDAEDLWVEFGNARGRVIRVWSIDEDVKELFGVEFEMGGVVNGGGVLKVGVVEGRMRMIEWPGLNFQGTVEVAVERGFCCGTNVVVPTLHPDLCRPGFKFSAGRYCSESSPETEISIVQHTLMKPALNSVSNPGGFIGIYLSELTNEFRLPTDGLVCPDSYNIQSITTPPINVTLPEPNLYTLYQTCVSNSSTSTFTHTFLKPHADEILSRLMHVKLSPPSLKILSLILSEMHQTLTFTFTSPIQNTIIPKSAIQLAHLRQEATVGHPEIVSVEEIVGENEWRVTFTNNDRIVSGDVITLSMVDFSSISTETALFESGGWMSWFRATVPAPVKRQSDWSCRDSTPPYAPCMLDSVSASIGDLGKVVGVNYIAGAETSEFIVHFSGAVKAVQGGYKPSDVSISLISVGEVILNVTSVTIEELNGSEVRIVVAQTINEIRAACISHSNLEIGIRIAYERIVSIEIESGVHFGYFSDELVMVSGSEVCSKAIASVESVGSQENDEDGGNLQALHVLSMVLPIVFLLSVGLITVAVLFGSVMDFSNLEFI